MNDLNPHNTPPSKLAIELSSLKSAFDLSVVQQLLKGEYDQTDPQSANKALLAIETFARRAREFLSSDAGVTESESGSVHTLGSHARVVFPSFNNAEVKGKIDTGATSSSLHATDVQPSNGRVSFVSEMISPNVITLPVEGTQEVHSADYGGDPRPVVSLDIEIDGVPLKGVMFNLNDRSKMDSKLLVGQDVLKAGNFQVDVNKDTEEPSHVSKARSPLTVPENVQLVDEDEKAVYEAICLLVENKITLGQLVEYLRLEAVNRIKD